MSIKRGPLVADNFTMVPHHWVRNPSLTMAEKGYLTYVASHAAGYELTVRQMSKENGDGRYALQTIAAKLEAKGYLRRVRLRNEDGTLAGYDYELIECPEGVQDGSDQSGKPSTGDDQGINGVSAGGDQDQIIHSGKPAHKEEHPPEKTKKTTTSKASPSRGTRIPDDFQPDESLKQWFRDQRYGGPAEFWRTEHAKFCDYWTAQSGQRGTKADWPATWRNWMRKAAERVPAAGRPAQGGFKNSAEKQADENARRADVALIADEVAKQWGASGKDYAENLRVREEAERIYDSRVTTCHPSGYTHPNGGDIVDAEWTEDAARREVTAS
jgi:hypothetical protein